MLKNRSDQQNEEPTDDWLTGGPIDTVIFSVDKWHLNMIERGTYHLLAYRYDADGARDCQSQTDGHTDNGPVDETRESI